MSVQALISSWGMFGFVSCAVYGTAAIAIPNLASDDKKKACLAVAAMWLATFRKQAPMAYHLRGFLAITRRATLALTRGYGFVRPGDTMSTRHRVLLGDLDFNLHQNNAIYPAELDVQRFGYLIDLFTGHKPYAFPLIRLGWKLANGGVATWFLKEITLGGTYEINTRLAGIDSKWFYLRSDYVGGEKGELLHAIAITRIVLKKGRKTVPPSEALAWLAYKLEDIEALAAKGEGDFGGLPLDHPQNSPDVALGPGMTALLKAVMLPATADTPFASPTPRVEREG